MASGCGVYVNDEPCARPEMERLRYLNDWMDYPGPLGLALCADHLAEYLRDSLLAERGGVADGGRNYDRRNDG